MTSSDLTSSPAMANGGAGGAIPSIDALDVVFEDNRWETLAFEPLCQSAAVVTLTHLGLDPTEAEVTVLACDDARIAELNADFRGKPRPTNVLSWPAEERAADQPGAVPLLPEPSFDGALELGDIAISYDTCAREAEAAGKPMADHVTHLMVHGLLHLLGYDHENDADATLMEKIEVEILGKLGIDDPYST
jgi:probable rRNA maturation factor